MEKMPSAKLTDENKNTKEIGLYKIDDGFELVITTEKIDLTKVSGIKDIINRKEYSNEKDAFNAFKNSVRGSLRYGWKGTVKNAPAETTPPAAKRRKAKRRPGKRYCQKHDLAYSDYLAQCPVCVGEQIAPATNAYRMTIATPPPKADAGGNQCRAN